MGHKLNNHSLFSYFLKDIWLVPAFAIMNNAAINICVQIFVWTWFSLLPRKCDHWIV